MAVKTKDQKKRVEAFQETDVPVLKEFFKTIPEQLRRAVAGLPWRDDPCNRNFARAMITVNDKYSREPNTVECFVCPLGAFPVLVSQDIAYRAPGSGLSALVSLNVTLVSAGFWEQKLPDPQYSPMLDPLTHFINFWDLGFIEASDLPSLFSLESLAVEGTHGQS